MLARFYGHFAACYGTLWLVLLGAAVVGQTHIDAGEFGVYGFPLISLVYAAIRIQQSEDGTSARGGDAALRRTIEDLHRQIARLEIRLEDRELG